VSSIRVLLGGEWLRVVKPGYLQLNYFMAFKAAWIFPVILAWLWLGRRPVTTLVMVGSSLAILAAALLVLDLSRASTFCFPAVIMGMLALWEYAPRQCVHVLGACYVVNLITPFYQGMTSNLFTIHYPLVVEIARRVF
jgi:hypothetical protein